MFLAFPAVAMRDIRVFQHQYLAVLPALYGRGG
jgi:hypothetical protein